MSDSDSPILIYETEGGIPAGGTGAIPGPVYSQAGTTQLIEGQAYIDVVFGSIQVDDEWVLVECIVVNEFDAEPLNIWPGIITDKLASGFRLQLNGMPDSGNYYLHWAVSGINIEPSPAGTYFLTGPATGDIAEASDNFTVALPPSTTLAAPVIVTPDDGGGGGTFTPTFVTITTGSPSATFTYTPAAYGAHTVSTTNSGPLTNPAGIVISVFSSTYTFTGPTSGNVSVASTNFTVALPVGGVVAGTVTVTPGSGGGGGTFTPASVALTTAAPSVTFTYTPASSGTKTLSVTNDGSLTNPGSISYVVTAPFDPTTIAGLKLWLKADAILVADGGVDGSSANPWRDQSGNGYDFAGGGTYKTNILNGKPVVRLNGLIAGNHYANITNPIIPVGTTGYTVLIVVNAASISAGEHMFFGVNNAATDSVILRRDAGDLNQFQHNGGYASNSEAGGIVAGAWNYITIDWNGSNIHMWRNGTLKGTTGVTTISTAGNYTAIGYDNISGLKYSDCDIAEVIVYNSALSGTDRGNVEAYLAAKYGL